MAFLRIIIMGSCLAVAYRGVRSWITIIILRVNGKNNIAVLYNNLYVDA